MGEDITVRESGIYLLNRVEVTLKDDSRAEGILQNIAAETITVEGREIMLSDVADIRLAGELTDYNVMRDTGMIGNFTFAPEACRDAAELELMRYGDFACTVSCHLKLAAGKICADDIRLVSHTHKVCVEKLSQTEAIYRFFDGSFFFPNALRTNGFIGNCYVSQNYAKMENAGLPRGNIMFSQDQIDFGFKPGNIYVVSYTCAKEPGEMVQEAVSVTLEKMHPCADYAKVWIDGNGEVNTAEETVLQTGDIAQVRYVGLITAYRTDNGTGYISGEYWFHVNNLTDAGEASQLVLGRRVSFTLEQTLKGKLCAAKDVALVSEKTVIAEEKQEQSKPERLRGYIVKYMIKQPVSAGFGFIVPEEELEAHLEDKEGTVYFKQTDIDCETMPKLNTKSYYYEVLYTPYTLHGKTCAKDVKIGAGHSYPEKKSTAPAAVTAVTKKIVSKTLPLAEYLEAEEARYAGASPKLGIISLYNGHYALISDCYINKKLVTDQEYAPDGAIAIFNPELAQIETEETIKTAKHCYLVKYVPGGTMVNEKTGMEHPSVDYNYPVLVLASFAKNQYICLKIEADALQVRKVEQVMSTLGTAVPEQVDFDIPELCNGESVIFELTDSTAAYHVIDSVGDDFYRINAQKFNAELG